MVIALLLFIAAILLFGAGFVWGALCWLMAAGAAALAVIIFILALGLTAGQFAFGVVALLALLWVASMILAPHN